MKEKIKKLAVSVLGYSIIAGIILFVIAIIAVIRALVASGWSTEKQGIVFYVILDTLFSAVSMAFADYFMDSVSASDLAILIISFLFAVITIKDFREDVRKDQERRE